MKIFKSLLILGIFSICMMAPLESYATDFSIISLAGYNSGIGFSLSGKVSQFAEGFPLHVKLGLGYTLRNPGSPTQARKIFINDATNGTPEKKGSVWDLKLDLLLKVGLFSMKDAYIYGGIRYASFTGNFNFVGGNENFDVTSKQWGFGLGLESYFKMGSKVDLVISSGVEYYLRGTLTGHDTSYSPTGENVNPRRKYTYIDANTAINQPEWVFRVMTGINYRF